MNGEEGKLYGFALAVFLCGVFIAGIMFGIKAERYDSISKLKNGLTPILKDDEIQWEIRNVK